MVKYLKKHHEKCAQKINYRTVSLTCFFWHGFWEISTLTKKRWLKDFCVICITMADCNLQMAKTVWRHRHEWSARIRVDREKHLQVRVVEVQKIVEAVGEEMGFYKFSKFILVRLFSADHACHILCSLDIRMFLLSYLFGTFQGAETDSVLYCFARCLLKLKSHVLWSWITTTLRTSYTNTKNLQQFKIRSSSTKTPGGKLSLGYPGGKLSVEAISVCEKTIDEAPGLHILHSDSQCHEKRPTQGHWLDQFVVLASRFLLEVLRVYSFDECKSLANCPLYILYCIAP